MFLVLTVLTRILRRDHGNNILQGTPLGREAEHTAQ